MNYINRDKAEIIEGELRCAELADYLKNMDAPMVVWFSEDASGIVPRVSYHSPSSQLVGLVLPTEPTTGMPISRSFKPQKATEVAQQMTQPKSTLVYIVMAQPIMDGVPPFIFQLFGTNNTFTTQDVQRRWNHTLSELDK